MPAILIQLFVCSWKGHVWGKTISFPGVASFCTCERCGALKQDK